MDIFYRYDALKDYIRARIRKMFISDLDGFELLEEDEQKQLIDSFVVKMFNDKEITIPVELIIIDSEKCLRTFTIKDGEIDIKFFESD